MSTISLPLSGLLLLSLAAVTAFQGCGRDSAVPGEPPAPPRTEMSAHHAVAGSLVAAVQETLKDSSFECDHLEADRRLEIATELDKRNDEIQALIRNMPASTHYVRVPLGTTFVRELSKPFKMITGWAEDVYGWAAYHDTFKKILSTPTDSHWISLSNEVRSILVDDQDRLDGQNVWLDKDSGPKLEVLLKEVSQCILKKCTTLGLSASTREFALSNHFYNSYLYLIERPKEGQFAPLLARFEKRISRDFRRYQFRINPTVVRSRPDELIIPLDATAFEGAETQLANYIERVWKVAGLQIRLDFGHSDVSLADLFRVLLGQQAGSRSFVSWTDHVVQLYPDVRANSIAHEIGHVLGFKDHYYTRYDELKCQYTTQSNDSDIMSNPDTGGVVSEEWAELRARYPFK